MEPYLKSKEEVLKELLSSHEGLSKEEAEKRLQEHGYNRLKEAKKILF